jgi:hypothetical protein
MGIHASTDGHSILYIVGDLIAYIRQFKQFLLDNLIFGVLMNGSAISMSSRSPQSALSTAAICETNL